MKKHKMLIAKFLIKNFFFLNFYLKINKELINLQYERGLLTDQTNIKQSQNIPPSYEGDYQRYPSEFRNENPQKIVNFNPITIYHNQNLKKN